VSTDGAKDTPGPSTGADLYNDAGADLELVETVAGGGIFESKPFVIVADKDDDKWRGGRVANDGDLNDPTITGWPGGTLKISVPDLNNAIIDFPIKRFSHFFTCYKVIAGEYTGDVPSSTAIFENMWRLKEIYAPLHERVDLPTAPAALISQAELQAIVGSDNRMNDFEATKLVEKVDQLGLPADAIKVVFICKPITRNKNPDDPQDFGLGGQNQAAANRNDIVFCFLASVARVGSSNDVSYFSKRLAGTVAHECGHSLRGVGHGETGGVFYLPELDPFTPSNLPKWHVMAFLKEPIDNLEPVKSGKHWYLKDEAIVHSAAGNKYSKKIP
jgi:hypothetical protein